MARGKILIVEDSVSQAEELRKLFLSIGYSVDHETDGITAIRNIASHKDIDLIILDRMLPDISGTEICRWMKANSKTRSIPIIMLTAENGTDSKVAGLESGADDYITKPFEKTELAAKIFSFLRLKSIHDDLKEEKAKLEKAFCEIGLMALTDSLTGLPNRTHFDSTLLKLFKQSMRYKTPLACMIIDIDHFKRINDTHGHTIGDKVLVKIAHLLKTNFRDVDMLARWGGEEFITLLPQTDTDGALVPAERILKTVSANGFQPVSWNITVSIGIASVPNENIKDEESLIKAADDCLYKAKTGGRNRIEIFR